mmetsp:Transcript_52042/g.114209  ORF Transcript_52042/g.114209 Transcript_52042/m.114209 type:complete len:262 (-) Transcript_52042:2082-2867(-)
MRACIICNVIATCCLHCEKQIRAPLGGWWQIPIHCRIKCLGQHLQPSRTANIGHEHPTLPWDNEVRWHEPILVVLAVHVAGLGNVVPIQRLQTPSSAADRLRSIEHASLSRNLVKSSRKRRPAKVAHVVAASRGRSFAPSSVGHVWYVDGIFVVKLQFQGVGMLEAILPISTAANQRPAASQGVQRKLLARVHSTASRTRSIIEDHRLGVHIEIWSAKRVAGDRRNQGSRPSPRPEASIIQTFTLVLIDRPAFHHRVIRDK